MTAEQSQVLELLAGSRFADGFSETQVRSMASAARLVRLNKGQTLFEEGTYEDEVYVVSSGRMALLMRVPRRGHVKLLTLGPGDLVGWSGLVSDNRMTATAVADDASVLIGLSGRILQQLCVSDPEFGCVLMTRVARVLSRRLLATRLQLLDLFQESEPCSSILPATATVSPPDAV